MLHKALLLFDKAPLTTGSSTCTAWCSTISTSIPAQSAVSLCLAQAAFPGLGAIVLDALTRREWVKEDELALQLKVHPKVLRRVLRYLEQVRCLPARVLVTSASCSLATPSLQLD